MRERESRMLGKMFRFWEIGWVFLFPCFEFFPRSSSASEHTRADAQYNLLTTALNAEHAKNGMQSGARSGERGICGG